MSALENGLYNHVRQKINCLEKGKDLIFKWKFMEVCEANQKRENVGFANSILPIKDFGKISVIDQLRNKDSHRSPCHILTYMRIVILKYCK